LEDQAAKDMQLPSAAEDVEIGRSWPIWPTVSRSPWLDGRYAAFCAALDKVWA